MSVPSAPATKSLAESLNVVGKIVKTSKYKFYDWNIKLPKGTTKLPDAEFKKLSRAATFFREGYYTTEDIKKIQADAKLAKEAEKKAKEATKLAKESKNLWDKFLSKTKGIGQLAKAGEAGSTVAKSGAALAKFAPILTAIASIGISYAVNIIQGWRNDINEDGQQLLSQSISQALGLMNVQKLKIDKINVEIKEAELENQRVRDRVYGVEKQLPGIRESTADANKKSNDALYETRVGRTKLEADIADAKKKSNDALYETRAGRTKLEDKIVQVQSQINKFTQGAASNFQSKIENTIGIIQNRLSTTENKVTTLEKIKPTLQDKLLQTVQDTVKKVSGDLGSAVTRLSQVEKQVRTVEVEHPKKWTTSISQTDAATRAYIDKKIQSSQPLFNANSWINKYGDSLVYLLNKKIPSLDKVDSILAQTDSTLAGGIATLKADTEKRLAQVEKPSTVGDTGVTRVELQLKDVKAELDKLKISDTKINTDLKDLTGKVKEQEKVNLAAIPKLDQILGILPFIPARTADVIRPSIPTVPQIENAAKTGTCQTFQPGGCGANALNGLGNGINQNTNNQSNNLFDKINAGANVAQLVLLKIIDNKLGAQIAGGISGKLVAGFKWLQLDRALNLLTFAATIQNHIMLSNNIAETLFGALDNVFKVFGLKDDSGTPFTLSNSIATIIKGIVGDRNYTTISETWAKANRIYQASSNVLNSFLNLSQTILQANELIAAHTGKIGNALRKGGVILENAYGWMNPQPKFNRTTQLLENLQNGASTIQMVTQAPLDVINATTELTTASTEFVKAVQEDDKPENKATPIPEPDELKAKETTSKSASQPLNFNFSDLFDGED